MSSLFKDIYNLEFYQNFGKVLIKSLPGFDQKRFLKFIFADDWADKELKERMRHTTEVLHMFMPGEYKEGAKKIIEIIELLKSIDIRETSIEYMFFPDYIEVYGLDDLDISINTIEYVTQFTSCEFAVRPFIKKYENEMVIQMIKWSGHSNHHVRRLATEGCRPRLPWAMALPSFKKDPKPILPILENLKNDTSEYVRRSVANNLNDISKDNPDITLKIFDDWIGKNKEVDWVVKHGCRTLLKQGLPEALKIFEYSSINEIELQDFVIHTSKIKEGNDLLFSFSLNNESNEIKKLRIEYGIFYMKANGALSKKVFKITENEYKAKTAFDFNRKQSFKPITTRKHYPGEHLLSIIINGHELAKKPFVLE